MSASLISAHCEIVKGTEREALKKALSRHNARKTGGGRQYAKSVTCKQSWLKSLTPVRFLKLHGKKSKPFAPCHRVSRRVNRQNINLARKNRRNSTHIPRKIWAR